MEMESQGQTIENKFNNRDKIFLVIIFLLLLGIAAMWIEWRRTRAINVELIETISSDLDMTTMERDAAKEELDVLLMDFDELETENDDMNDSIQAQKQKILTLMEDLDKNKKNSRWQIHKLKKEIATLRNIAQSYVVTIDSLNQANIALQEDLNETSQKLTETEDNLKKVSSERASLTEQVALGSKLNTRNMMGKAIKVKANGKQVETDRASKSDMIKTCFTLPENAIATSGEKWIYMRIISPKGEVLSDDNTNIMKFDKVSGLYSIKMKINYDRSEKDVCMYYGLNEEIPAGNYIVEVYADGTKIGTTNFDLR